MVFVSQGLLKLYENKNAQPKPRTKNASSLLRHNHAHSLEDA
jgi:hypothetical protein